MARYTITYRTTNRETISTETVESCGHPRAEMARTMNRNKRIFDAALSHDGELRPFVRYERTDVPGVVCRVASKQ
jgi:hypothetical protein